MRAQPLRRVLGLIAVTAVALSVGAAVSGADDDTPGEDSVAVGFARDMADHHAQAVEMAGLISDRTEDPDLRLLARDVALTQQAQIGRMQGWLDAWGRRINGGERMGWMGGRHGTMPGMASRSDIAELRAASGSDAERRFLKLMIAHHSGGVTMAAAALEADVANPVRRLAEAIVESQRAEIALLQAELAERGGPSDE